MIEVITISDRFDLGDKVVVTCNATKKQRQAIVDGATVGLISSSGDVLFDRMEEYGSIDRSEFLSGPDLKNIGMSFEQLTNPNQVPDDATIRIHFRNTSATG